MLYKPLVVFFHTSVCPFCSNFKRRVFKPYWLRDDIHAVPVEVGMSEDTKFIENPEMKEMPSSMEQEFLAAGSMNKGGPVVPAVKVVSPAQLMDEMERPWRVHEQVFIFPGGEEEDFHKAVRKKMDKYIERRAYIHSKHLR